jgi:hypothetical protein
MLTPRHGSAFGESLLHLKFTVASPPLTLKKHVSLTCRSGTWIYIFDVLTLVVLQAAVLASLPF